VVRPQLRLQPLHGLIVQVVGRLVQKQQLGAAGEGAGQDETGALASGEVAESASRQRAGRPRWCCEMRTRRSASYPPRAS
jgi:hypothetical protein